MNKTLFILFCLFVLSADGVFISIIDSREKSLKACFATLDDDNAQLRKDVIQFDQIREAFNEH